MKKIGRMLIVLLISGFIVMVVQDGPRLIKMISPAQENAAVETVDERNAQSDEEPIVDYMWFNPKIPVTGRYVVDSYPIIQHVDAKGHYEQRKVKDAWDEKVQTGTRTVVVKDAWDEVITTYTCSGCGAKK